MQCVDAKTWPQPVVTDANDALWRCTNIDERWKRSVDCIHRLCMTCVDNSQMHRTRDLNAYRNVRRSPATEVDGPERPVYLKPAPRERDGEKAVPTPVANSWR